jgi:hypothetical protein
MKTKPRSSATKQASRRRGGRASEQLARGGLQPPSRTPPHAGDGEATIAHPRDKSRGGQPGNHNAYKHGFYSHLFRDRERRILSEQPLTDLSAEIELLHVTTARFLEALQSSGRSTDFETNLAALRLVNLSAQSIAALVRVQVLTGAFTRELDDESAELLGPEPTPDDPTSAS